jgi:hypothetical protein
MPSGDIDAFSDLDEETVDRILTGYDHESISEALAADVVDFVPIVGDTLALKRHRHAEEDGVEIPDKPALIENAASDLPTPLDSLVDAAVSQNTIRYVNQNSKASPFLAIDKRTNEIIARIPPQRN